MELLLATQNKGKIVEITALLKNTDIRVFLPEDEFDVEETGTTFEENARLKANAWFERYAEYLVLSEDSGLLVDALDGRPGVYSKRYGKNDIDRNQKLLKELEGVEESKRGAHFITVACLKGKGIDEVFEGRVDGRISMQMQGDVGFGYDPVFIPEGYDKTFAQLGQQVKHRLSHRARALSQVVDFLKNPTTL